jgi:DNA processing protein
MPLLLNNLFGSKNKNVEYSEETISMLRLIRSENVGPKTFISLIKRNRIISGISLETVVVKASFKSGSLITAKFAAEQNRKVFAVPGFPLDPRCQGTHSLIKDDAHSLESVDDIFSHLPRMENSAEVDFELLEKHVDSEVISDGYDALTDGNRRQILECLSTTSVQMTSIANATEFTSTSNT